MKSQAQKTSLLQIIPVKLSFIAMGLDDHVGTPSKYLQKDLRNPLVTNINSGDKLVYTLTFGQFVKAIASFLAPILAAWGATTYLPVFGLGWRALFVIYAAVCFISIAILAATPINEEKPDKASGILDCLRLLGRPFIILCFIGIMCHVGIDVGTNTTAPKIIMEQLGLPLEDAGFATSVYFIFRTAGCFLGAIILRSLSPKLFFAVSVAMMLVGMVLLFVGSSIAVLYTGIGLIGFGNSNVFSIIFAQALVASPDKKNEVSGLMIMGLFGGTIFPLAMGYAADAVGQAGAVAVMTAGVAYLIYYTLKIKTIK